jgi:O-antigen biosynthesis protein
METQRTGAPVTRFVRRGAASLRRRSQPLLRRLRGRPWLKVRTGDLRVSFAYYESPDVAALLSRLAGAREVIVVIPVYDGGDIVRACLDSVVAFTAGRRIVVIDDGSTDAATLAMLAEFAADGRIEVVTHAKNQGYTRTANHALSLAPEADIVLLNSDTEVGPLWLERLRWTAHSVQKSAGASAFSDSAGAYALPVTAEPNTWPRERGWTRIARYVSQHADGWAIEGPTIHGFCVYFKRDALEAIGSFDRKLFPRGYGEENEWSMRALAEGFVSLGAPHVFVGHRQGATFGSARVKLIHRARRIIDELHPSFGRLVDEWWHSAGFDAVRANSAASRAALEAGADAIGRVGVIGAVAVPGVEIVALSDQLVADDVRLAAHLIEQAVESVRVEGEVPQAVERVCGLLGIPLRAN